MAKNGNVVKLPPVRAEERVQWARERMRDALTRHLADPSSTLWLSALRSRLAELEELERAPAKPPGRPRKVPIGVRHG